jgi:hypothetical protein
MFTYKSTEIKSISKNGSNRTTRRNNVTVKGRQGTKSVSFMKNGKKVHTKTIPLTNKEIACIMRREFVPGLFKDCMTMRKNSRKTRRIRK